MSEWELVRDGLPECFDLENYKFLPNMFVMWNGSVKSEFESARDVTDRKVVWRPRFTLRSNGGSNVADQIQL